MLQLLEFGMDWETWRTGADREYSSFTQIVEEITELNIPVTQIVEEIGEVNIPVTRIVEEITELNIPVPQIVEEIAKVSKSSIEWRSIPNLYFEEIKVFLG